MGVKGAIALITGGASGIGAAIARRLVASGAGGIGIADLNEDAAERASEEIRKSGVRSLAAKVDVGDEAQVVAFVDRAERELGPTTIMCSNAGIFAASETAPTDADWERSWRINVMSNIFVAREIVPRMTARGHGHLIVTCSAAGLLANRNAPYMVTKHAAVAFAEWLAIHCRSRGLNVSALCPLGVQTDMLTMLMKKDAEAAAGVLAGGEVITTDQVADAVLQALVDKRFLILPHPVVKERIVHKANDRDQWITRIEQQFGIAGVQTKTVRAVASELRI